MTSGKFNVSGISSAYSKLRLPPCRFILVAMGFWAICNLYTLRVDISVAVVDMVNATYQKQVTAAAAAKTTPVVNTTVNKTVVATVPCLMATNSSTAKDGPFQWDSSQQLMVTGAYYYGYICTQIAGGIVAQRFGAKLVLLIGLGISGALTVIAPPCTMYGGYAAIIALRVIIGFFSGISFPSMSALLSNWAPPMERTIMSSCVFAGSQIGTVIGMSVTGALGWQGSFYLFGCVTLLWAVLWFFLVYNSPSKHPRITQEEFDYLEKNLGKQEKKTMVMPWLAILKSPPFYALISAHFACLWGYYMLLSTLPTYFAKVMLFDIKQNGALSGAPYVAMWGMMLVSATIADQIRTRKLLSTTIVRKIYFSFGFLVPAACLIGTGFIDCQHPYSAVGLIIAAVACSAPAFGAWNVNHLDLAPPYAGTLMGITNSIATIPGFTATVCVSNFTVTGHTMENWRNVFYVTAAIYVFGTIMFLVFGSGELQPWGMVHKKDPTDKKEVDPNVVEMEVTGIPEKTLDCDDDSATVNRHATKDVEAVDNKAYEPDTPVRGVTPADSPAIHRRAEWTDCEVNLGAPSGDMKV